MDGYANINHFYAMEEPLSRDVPSDTGMLVPCATLTSLQENSTPARPAPSASASNEQATKLKKDMVHEE